ncbi:hypothetical protein [Pedobacter nutrimenti]|uniref:Uncharacterized protein n=1 Tax=Pedobacter nutrimenti TaxID=1241337 RepID=A0A318U6F6_9SPHI|nr:hypothetical protein [Pedobacter nutrimenti]PYF68831.1 hypothetical protein B0O44_1119 [Pedobacter nutrimenti]
MNKTLGFPLKVWLTSIFIGPLLLLLNTSNSNAVMFNTDITQIIDYVFSSDFVSYYLLAVGIGAACSIPCFLLLWLFYALLKKTALAPWGIRGVLMLFSTGCSAGIFMMFSMSDLGNFWNKGNLVMIASYAIPLVFGLLLYRMDRKIEVVEEVTEKEE